MRPSLSAILIAFSTMLIITEHQYAAAAPKDVGSFCIHKNYDTDIAYFTEIFPTEEIMKYRKDFKAAIIKVEGNPDKTRILDCKSYGGEARSKASAHFERNAQMVSTNLKGYVIAEMDVAKFRATGKAHVSY